MGFKDRKKELKGGDKKEAAKPVKEQSNKVQKVEKKVVEPIKEVKQKIEKPKTKELKAPVIETPVVEIQKTEKAKTDYYGIGIVGNHEEINKFRGICKIKNKKVGDEIINWLRGWNKLNS